MKLLVVKTSSLGDIIHALPAITDVKSNIPDVTVDWVVEEAFVDIPSLHPAVSRVIPVALRRWRGNLRAARAEVKTFYGLLRSESYDLVIDAQGLLKSALIAGLARGRTGGFDAKSSREGLSSLFYDEKVTVDRTGHAIDRVRLLFAALLDYAVVGEADSGLGANRTDCLPPTVMLLHGTTWPSKHWPVEHWRAVVALAEQDGFRVLVPAASSADRSRAETIARGFKDATVLPAMGLRELAEQIPGCTGAVCVDSGLGHLASAFGVPLVALYGPTDPALTGPRRKFQVTLVSDHLPCIPCRKRNCEFSIREYSSKIYPPCFTAATPEATWQALQRQIKIARPSPT